MTPKKIKTMYPSDKWREVAEHFGYTYDEVVNAAVEQSGGKKSLWQKLKEFQI